MRIVGLAMVALIVSSLPFAAAARAQNMDKAVINVDEEVTAFAYSPDGRIVFSVRRMFKATKKYELQRDDIWLLETNGKRKRLLEGQKFTHGDKPFTYQVESFTWSPNGHIVAIQLYTSTVDPDDSREDARALLLLDDSGRELHPAGSDPLVMNAESPMWLRDNGTLVYLVEEVAPRQLFSMKYLYMSSGPATKAFEGRTFVDAERIPGSNSAVAVERDRAMDGPPRMQKLELLAQDDKELATLDSFVGAGLLSISPTGTMAAYFLDNEVLEIRNLEDPNKVARLRVGLGVLKWSADETKIYLKRTIEKKSADLVTFDVPMLATHPRGQQPPLLEPEPRPMLHGLTIREYGLSPDGKYLAVVLPGKRNLQVFGF
jgi:dipeptidyl aminopeptidase/acylaminoacyl peptidase